MTGPQRRSTGGRRQLAPPLMVMSASLLVLLLLLGAGSGLISRPEPAGTATAPAPATGEDRTTRPEPLPSWAVDMAPEEPAVDDDPPRSRLELGQAHERGEGVTVTAHAVRRDLPHHPGTEPAPGMAWYAVDAELCMEDVLLSPEYFQSFSVQWTLEVADPEAPDIDWAVGPVDGLVEDPLDLFTTEPSPHTCYRGWIVLDGPADAEILAARVQMSPDVEWAVPAG